MGPDPKIVDIDITEVEATLQQVESCLGEEACRPLRAIVRAYLTVVEALKDKTISIQRLRNLLWGPKTERRPKRKPDEENASAEPSEGSTNGEGTETTGEHGKGRRAKQTGSRKKRKGHGRNGADAYTGARWHDVPHSTLQHRGPCPCPLNGRLYLLKEPSTIVRVHGHAPVSADVYRCERLRCQLCGKVFTAEPPKDIGEDKYDPSVASTIATLRYGCGMPMNRIEGLQALAGVPLPASNQWELMAEAMGATEPAYEQLVWHGAQGEQFHNDDTPARILEMMDETTRQAALHEDDPDRKGLHTTGMLCLSEGHWIALFSTGPRHAGENLQQVLDRRQEGLPTPRQMCDALSRNEVNVEVLLGNCMAHGRRQFVERAEMFPDEVGHVLKELAKVYRLDAKTKKRGMSDQQRLEYHQQTSGRVMGRLHTWLQQRFEQKLVEPNSSLGQAIKYMLRHWEKLTLFLRVPGAPLDNNICEQALKMVIRHRKNSLFYKTRRGAEVGDVYMSLIHTCRLNGVDPWHYLTELQRNKDQVAADPASWMPWNYLTARSRDGPPRQPT